MWKKISQESIAVETGGRSMGVHSTTHLLLHGLSRFYNENMAVAKLEFGWVRSTGSVPTLPHSETRRHPLWHH